MNWMEAMEVCSIGMSQKRITNLILARSTSSLANTNINVDIPSKATLNAADFFSKKSGVGGVPVQCMHSGQLTQIG